MHYPVDRSTGQSKRQVFWRSLRMNPLGKYLGLMLLTAGLVMGWGMPTIAQVPLLDELEDTLPELFKAAPVQDDFEVAWVRLDGRSLFRIAAPANELAGRTTEIQYNLDQISQDYRYSDQTDLHVDVRGDESLPTLYVNDRYVMTVTHFDAQLYFVTPSHQADVLQQAIADAIRESQRQYQPEYLLNQGQFALGILLIMVVLSGGLYGLGLFWRRSPSLQSNQDSVPTSQITNQLNQQRRENIGAVRGTLVQLGQISLWVSGSLIILGRFPYTRPFQVWILGQLSRYFGIILIGLGTYVMIRLSYVLIDWLIGLIIPTTQPRQQRAQRLHQRITTISGVTKGIATVFLLAIALLLMLFSLQIDIGPLIAGAGLIGVAISLASQNLIRDAINGFLILLEDQYAVGDVIMVGDVFGIVESMTLRITQLRDPEERLITIPNSEIKVVANMSSLHSQADIKIPVAYSSDINRALEIVHLISAEMQADPTWCDRILMDPMILGLDEFAERGMVIRVWIRTQRLEHWNVAREFRRRIKTVFDAEGVSLAIAQQDVWIHGKNDPVISPSESLPLVHLNDGASKP